MYGLKHNQPIGKTKLFKARYPFLDRFEFYLQTL